MCYSRWSDVLISCWLPCYCCTKILVQEELQKLGFRAAADLGPPPPRNVHRSVSFFGMCFLTSFLAVFCWVRVSIMSWDVLK